MLGAYKYEEQNVKDVFQVIWEKAYALILNCNIIIEKCDERQDVLPGVYYGLYKGEALALGRCSIWICCVCRTCLR